MKKYIIKNMFFYVLFGTIFFLMPTYLLGNNSNIPDSKPDSLYYSANEIVIQFKINFNFDFVVWEKTKKFGNNILDSLNSNFHVNQIIPLSIKKNYSAINKIQIKSCNVFLFRFQEIKSIRKLLKHYRMQKIVRYAEPNYYYFYKHQKKNRILPLDKIQMNRAAEFIHFENPVVIGIIGTGIDWQRKKLMPHIWQNPYEKIDGKDNDGNGLIDDIHGADFTILDSPVISTKSMLYDKDGFGTDLYETIDRMVNFSNNKKNYHINKLMILKAGKLHSKNKIILNTFSLIRAIFYAANNNANILSISAYGDYPSEILKHAINYANDNNCTVIAPAGDKNSSAPVYPAAFENVISVAATDFEDKKTQNSNFGDWVDIAAPGYLNYQNPDTVKTISSETAIAAAQVTGLAGLLLTGEKKIDNDSLMKRMFFSSENIYRDNQDFYGMLGPGRINVFRALQNKQHPNIIINKVDFQLAEQKRQIGKGDTISVNFKLLNLSATAKNITIKMFSKNKNVHIVNSEDFIPNLCFQNEYENKNKPLKLLINKNLSDKDKPEIILQIKADENFSFSNTYTILPGSANTKNLPLPSEAIFVQKNQIKYTFSPLEDTTIISVGDSLKFYFNLQNASDSLNFKWFLNDSVLSEINDSTFMYSPLIHSIQRDSFDFSPPTDIEGIVKISAVIFSNDSTFKKQKDWYIKFILETPPAEDIFYYPVTDTTIFEGDSLKLGVSSFPNKDSVVNFKWSINNLFDSLNTNPSYLITTNSFSSGIDTVSLSFKIGDSLFTHQWTINIQNRNRPPQIISAIPGLDSILTKVDSILFRISCFDEDKDTLQYRWSLNNIIDTAAIDSFYYYIGDSTETLDSVTVFVSDNDTSIFAQWIVFPHKEQMLEKIFDESITFYPETDSLFTESDSLFFFVSNLPDSIETQWYINNRLDSTNADSSFIYYIPDKENTTDTIKVKIISHDSTLSHDWYIHYSKISDETDSLKLSFFPKIETIAFSTNDSLKFFVQLEEGNLSDINIHWFINHELDESNTDTIFHFVPDTCKTTVDTITALITHADTTIIFNWEVLYEAIIKLPAPVLLYPIEGNRISEFQTLMWENDSSLAAIDSTVEWKYIVQLSNDSTFSQIFSSDTCSTLSLPLNNLNGFKKMTIGAPVYWHVKIFAGENKLSEFAKSRSPFYYYPTFIILNNFYGEKKQDGIHLYWTTSYEANCVGFNVFRSETPDGNFEKITEYLITGKTNYSWIDKISQAGATFYYRLEEISKSGRKKFHQSISIESPAPASYSLSHNFPNPFNSTTSFKYQIPKTTRVLIEVFNILGKKVKTLIDERKDAGFYTVYWDGVDDNGENVVSGIYFYIISADKFHATQKMIVVR